MPEKTQEIEELTTTVTFNNKNYTLDKRKLLAVIRRFENNPDFEFKNDTEIFKLLKKHKLLDEYFLNNVNNL